MSGESERFSLLRGRPEPPGEMREVGSLDLSALLDGIDLRYVHLGETELLRRVYVAVRDREWRTVLPRSCEIEARESDHGFSVRFDSHYLSSEVELVCRGTIACEDGERLEFRFEAEAARDFPYSRIGICLHHPWRETAGARFRARTPTGELTGEFPELIGPQLFRDGTFQPLFAPFDRLEIDLESGGTLTFEFEGDLWETEDQRNWTDANFKTYSTPLAMGPPPPLRQGQTLRQRVVLDASAVKASGSKPGALPRITVLGPLGVTVPTVGLGADRDRHRLDQREAELLRALSPRHIRVDLRLDRDEWPETLAAAQETAARLETALELALMLTGDDLGHLEHVARASATGPPVARVLVTVAGVGPRVHEQTTPAPLVHLVRERLVGVMPNAEFLGGTEMHFAELNRVRPEPTTWDGVCYSITPQMHAFGDVDIVESLEAQAETVRSTHVLGTGKPVVVSPVTLAPRANFYSSDPVEAVELGVGLPASVDLRQSSLLGAAWTAGSLKYLAEAGAHSVTYYETTGWRGVIERSAGSDRGDRFSSEPGAPFPLYHVLSDACEWVGLDVLECRSTEPLAVVGFAVRDAESWIHLLLANLTSQPRTVLLEGLSSDTRARFLDDSRAALAAHDVQAFRQRGEVIEAGEPRSVAIAPYGVIRIDERP